MKKLILVALVIMFIGCGNDDCCPKNDHKIKNTASGSLASGSNKETPTAKIGLHIATPEEVALAKANGTLIQVGDPQSVEIKPTITKQEIYDVVFYCKCNQTEYTGSKLIVDVVDGSKVVKLDLTDEVIEIQGKHPNAGGKYYKLVNSGNLYLDNYHELDGLEKEINNSFLSGASNGI